MLTAEVLRSLLMYDTSTGHFTWRQARGNSSVGNRAGCLKETGYRAICIENRHYREHRLAWLYVHGEWPSGEIDHINGDRADNRLSNLRDVSHSLNQQNRPVSRRNKLGVLGVCRDSRGNGFRADIRVNGKLKFLGRFETIAEAAAAYQVAKRQFHPDAQRGLGSFEEGTAA